ncbi:hypothetical protein [Streptomyces sp. NPDC001985]|uniref:hypothetical protein n=1 Tax=Streptomyces sp. NPDC001985 TaxID=3154406 RepID=UPI0033345CFC
MASTTKGGTGMRTWMPRQWGVAIVVAALAAVAIGVPTGVVPTGLFGRMTPVLWWNYPVWAAGSVLTGLLAGTYAGGARPRAGERPHGGRALAAAALSALAVGCPVCNKLVVLALGMSGAMSYWAPAQPVLAVASLALLGHALVRRLRTADACPVPAAAAPAVPAAPAPASERAPAAPRGDGR